MFLRGAPVAALLSLVLPVQLLSLTGACSFDASLPANAQLTCTDDGDCPSGQVCLSLVGRCVERSGADTTPPSVADVVLSAERLAADDVLAVSFRVDETLLLSPVIEAGAARPTLERTSDRYTFSIGATELGVGFIPITAALVDLRGNVGVAVLGVVEVDLSAPDILPDSVRWSIAPPPGAAPVQSDVLVLRSRGSLTFRIDDLGGAVHAVAAHHDSGARIDFEPKGHVDLDWMFEVVLDDAVAPGEWEVRAHTSDLLGNEADVVVPLPPPAFHVGEILVGACLAQHDDGSVACTDLDADGAYGAAAQCPQATDCDDTRTLVHPGSVEVPGNGLDDDCDGEELPLDAASGVFVSNAGAPGAAGTPDDPLDSIAEAATRDAMIFLQEGTYGLGPDRVRPSLIGGLDEQWRPAGVSILVGGTSGEIFAGGSTSEPYRLEGVTFIGENCAGVAFSGEPVEIERVAVLHRSTQCVGGEFPGSLFSDGDLLAAHIEVESTATGAVFGSMNGVLGLGAITLVDSTLRMVDGTRAVLGGVTEAATLVRTQVDVSTTFDGPLFGVEGQGPIVLVSTSISARAASGSAVAVTGEDLLAVHTTAVVGSLGNSVVCYASRGGARVWSSMCARGEDGAPRALTAASLDVRGTAFGPGMAECVTRGAAKECFDVAALNACAVPGCSAASDNVAVAGGEAAPGVPVIDLGAPSSVAMDADGDCRGAADVEAGADELP